MKVVDGKPTVFFEDHLANESDTWPQMVFSGDYYSDYLEKVIPGQWTYFSGDRNSDDGCEVYRTGIRGARNVLDALETVDSLSYFDNAERTELVSRASELMA
ncbi:hypothetical protein QEN42_07625 [Gordonia alkanivorans]|uniref:hypothetical protein n=1 Tax=Gordonia alkanivorans TaxID=84096 RepID=UPI00244D4EFD|nr:hypothetical protein [Gordonia alkanivorans]MDH3049744.1 hypothetical protein [Gordonia alkanivorans]